VDVFIALGIPTSGEKKITDPGLSGARNITINFCNLEEGPDLQAKENK